MQGLFNANIKLQMQKPLCFNIFQNNFNGVLIRGLNVGVSTYRFMCVAVNACFIKGKLNNLPVCCIILLKPKCIELRFSCMLILWLLSVGYQTLITVFTPQERSEYPCRCFSARTLPVCIFTALRIHKSSYSSCSRKRFPLFQTEPRALCAISPTVIATHKIQCFQPHSYDSVFLFQFCENFYTTYFSYSNSRFQVVFLALNITWIFVVKVQIIFRFSPYGVSPHRVLSKPYGLPFVLSCSF